jgi:hypothetical protein
MNNRTGITIGGTRYFMGFPLGSDRDAPAEEAQRSASDHNMLESTAAPKGNAERKIAARKAPSFAAV